MPSTEGLKTIKIFKVLIEKLRLMEGERGQTKKDEGIRGKKTQKGREVKGAKTRKTCKKGRKMSQCRLGSKMWKLKDIEREKGKERKGVQNNNIWNI